MKVPQDDWRRMGQEATLAPGTELVRKTYQPPRPSWDHDHCSFCFGKFVAPDDASRFTERVWTEGYATTDRFVRGADYEGVCPDCFADFAEEFG